jgi:hypothetical protein
VIVVAEAGLFADMAASSLGRSYVVFRAAIVLRVATKAVFVGAYAHDCWSEGAAGDR